MKILTLLTLLFITMPVAYKNTDAAAMPETVEEDLSFTGSLGYVVLRGRIPEEGPFQATHGATLVAPNVIVTVSCIPAYISDNAVTVDTFDFYLPDGRKVPVNIRTATKFKDQNIAGFGLKSSIDGVTLPTFAKAAEIDAFVPRSESIDLVNEKLLGAPGKRHEETEGASLPDVRLKYIGVLDSVATAEGPIVTMAGYAVSAAARVVFTDISGRAAPYIYALPSDKGKGLRSSHKGSAIYAKIPEGGWEVLGMISGTMSGIHSGFSGSSNYKGILVDLPTLREGRLARVVAAVQRKL